MIYIKYYRKFRFSWTAVWEIIDFFLLNKTTLTWHYNLCTKTLFVSINKTFYAFATSSNIILLYIRILLYDTAYKTPPKSFLYIQLKILQHFTCIRLRIASVIFLCIAQTTWIFSKYIEFNVLYRFVFGLEHMYVFVIRVSYLLFVRI